MQSGLKFVTLVAIRRHANESGRQSSPTARHTLCGALVFNREVSCSPPLWCQNNNLGYLLKKYIHSFGLWYKEIDSAVFVMLRSQFCANTLIMGLCLTEITR